MSDTDRSPSAAAHEYQLAPDESPSRGVWSVVAVLEDCPPPELPSLAETIDPEALDAAFIGTTATDHVSFEYAGYTITVTSDAVRARALECDAG
ncbi:hypothetical protein C491_17042 [Natronococcus amylolyticus DSM 10524]|uniref:Halobacterial output domain-containing protein n=1 Tax=Natronococcus amylolyticus DSM 10524 TaxID=1227497 RepID=L9X143_9EURY|nr:HalOD1 output domain-containing protein [Natronococcus amylolyticus]ELY55440.1 hypothetical protein C491_17042 [Natronococcus amylolyticus DSM 10524]